MSTCEIKVTLPLDGAPTDVIEPSTKAAPSARTSLTKRLVVTPPTTSSTVLNESEAAIGTASAASCAAARAASSVAFAKACTN